MHGKSQNTFQTALVLTLLLILGQGLLVVHQSDLSAHEPIGAECHVCLAGTGFAYSDHFARLQPERHLFLAQRSHTQLALVYFSTPFALFYSRAPPA